MKVRHKENDIFENRIQAGGIRMGYLLEGRNLANNIGSEYLWVQHPFDTFRPACLIVSDSLVENLDENEA